VLPIATTGRLGPNPVERLERGENNRNVEEEKICLRSANLDWGVHVRPVVAMGSTAWHHFRWSEFIYQDELEMIKRRSGDLITRLPIDKPNK
jgi:hypothetical protein